MPDAATRPRRERFLLIPVYAALGLAAVITLIPFFYLVCSSVKQQSVFFSSPFLPTAGLFEIEPSTGSIAVVDDSHLEGPAPWSVPLVLEASDPAGQLPAASREVEAVVTPGPGTGGPRYIVTLHPLGSAGEYHARSAVPSAAEVFDTDTAERPPRYRIAAGNPAGFLGIAWGQLTLDHFVRLAISLDPSVLRYALNSTLYASLSAVLATLLCAMGGYGLAMFEFRGRGIITLMVFGTLVVPGAVLLAPMYQLVHRLGLIDSFAGLILPGIAPAFGVFLFRQAMSSSVPKQLLEAARIDGCSEMRMFFAVAMPLVKPMSGAFMLITFLAAWNNFIWPQIVIATPDKMPLAVGVSQLRDVYAVDYGMLMAATLISIVPVASLFLVLQRDFIEGLTSGAVKG